MMQQVMVKAHVLTAKDCTFISFEKKLPCRGSRSQIVKEKIRREWVSRGGQPLPLPLIFIKPETLENISKKLNKKPTTIEIDIREILSFNSLKERLIQMYAK